MNKVYGPNMNANKDQGVSGKCLPSEKLEWSLGEGWVLPVGHILRTRYIGHSDEVYTCSNKRRLTLIKTLIITGIME